ncbi:MAG: phosphoglucosamine mutase [Candidatus Cloacimonetes bacterium]|nr:phosphoglucosamine mutase [Candidatus Cloacimonadota bacterium]
MTDLMKSVSGIRGLFGIALNPENSMKFASQFGLFQRQRIDSENKETVITKKNCILVGRDSRTTGELLSFAVISGLLSVGIDVIWLGIVATPTLLLNVKELNAIGGICITASHNPAEWNAMKFVDANGMFLYPEVMEEFLDIIQQKTRFSAPSHEIKNFLNAKYFADWDAVGKKYDDFDASWRHINKILAIPYININKIREMKYKVVLDSVNGAGGVISPTLLRELGCDVIEINSEPTGIFAHDPEPIATHLTQICNVVKEQSADIGFATDPDVDRLVIINEKGVCIGEEFSLLLAIKFVLKHKKGDIVTNLSSSMASDDIAQEAGVKVIRTKIGEINVGKTMIEINSPIGGEGNGGIICPDVNYTRDAVAGMALILGYMAERNMSISDLVLEIPRYFFAKEKIEVNINEMDSVLESLLNLFKNEKIDITDGLKVLFEKAWVHIRKSGTEPIIRVYAEAETEVKAKLLCSMIDNALLKS